MQWNPELYGRYAAERRAPFEDLWRLIAPGNSFAVIDLGCGTGELTAELQARLPGSNVLGVDNSSAMLARAASLARPGLRFEQRSIEGLASTGAFDLVFSHAALHWVDNHRALFPRLLGMLRPGGQLAVQVPANHGHPAHQLVKELAGEEPFHSAFRGWRRATPVLELDAYAQILHEAGAVDINALEKVYLHVLPDAAAVVEWLRATTLLPYLERLGSLSDDYLERYRERLAGAMPGSPVLFTFRRILLVAKHACDGGILRTGLWFRNGHEAAETEPQVVSIRRPRGVGRHQYDSKYQLPVPYT